MSVVTISAIRADIGGRVEGIGYTTVPQVAGRMYGRREPIEEPAAAAV
ncbi:MAG TPA: hypothetical protein VEF89_30530 [Solirubrobacteraceae bacterium]|nr:hypothetical protein [Solirubrobacteraceae bacterium]